MRHIHSTYHVSPQISVEDLPAIKAAGVTRLINNRPDGEVPPSHCGASIEAAA